MKMYLGASSLVVCCSNFDEHEIPRRQEVASFLPTIYLCLGLASKGIVLFDIFHVAISVCAEEL
jgi:hypothetical protein